MPLCLHAGASAELQYPPYAGLSPKLTEALEAVTKPVSSVFVISLFALSRVLMRHPRLRVVLAESALSWGMLYLEWTDHQFAGDGLANEGYDLKPSEMFRRQCYFTSWFDQVAPFAPMVGADRILWSTNLPLATSTFPRTRETVEALLPGRCAGRPANECSRATPRRSTASRRVASKRSSCPDMSDEPEPPEQTASAQDRVLTLGMDRRQFMARAAALGLTATAIPRLPRRLCADRRDRDRSGVHAHDRPLPHANSVP